MVDILEEMKVKDHMRPRRDQQIISEGMRVRDLVHRVATTDFEYFFIVDGQTKLTGMVSLDDIRRVMLDPYAENLIVARDLAIPVRMKLNAEDTLTYALSLFTSTSLNGLPVTDGDSGSLLGIIKKNDLIVAYNDELMKRKNELRGARAR
jgi:CIC family chloride channel protein